MKTLLFSLSFILTMVTISLGCKSKKEAGATNTTSVSTDQPAVKGNTVGKVSHQYRATGCATVIIVLLEGAANPLTLIPKDKLPGSFDVDGQELHFNYHTLKMPQPAGCNIGIPAELTDISKK